MFLNKKQKLKIRQATSQLKKELLVHKKPESTEDGKKRLDFIDEELA